MYKTPIVIKESNAIEINDRKLLIKKRINEIPRLSIPEYKYSFGNIPLKKTLAFFSSKLLKTLGATSAEKNIKPPKRNGIRNFIKINKYSGIGFINLII